MYIVVLFFFLEYGDHRDLLGPTPAFPTRRASDLPARRHGGRHHCLRLAASGDQRASARDVPILGSIFALIACLGCLAYGSSFCSRRSIHAFGLVWSASICQPYKWMPLA